MLKKGDLVWIYKDPYLQSKPEGEARLIKLISDHGPKKSYWTVRFSRDKSVVDRLIIED